MVCTYDLLKMVQTMATSLNYSKEHLQYVDFWHFKTLWETTEKTAISQKPPIK